MIGFRGDLEYLGKHLGLPHVASNYPCAWCRASRCADSPHPWTAFRETAAWRATIWKNDNVVGWAPNRQAIFSQLKLGPSNVFTDWMHCAHLGIYQYIFGSILSLLLDRVPGPSKEKRCAALFAEIRGFYKEPNMLDVAPFAAFATRDMLPAIRFTMLAPLHLARRSSNHRIGWDACVWVQGVEKSMLVTTTCGRSL